MGANAKGKTKSSAVSLLVGSSETTDGRVFLSCKGVVLRDSIGLRFPVGLLEPVREGVENMVTGN